MKSKFMRMVGRGVEDPEEEEQVFQEAEQLDKEPDKVLPQISDAEIDSLYEKFLTTGFTSPYITNKRLYVLDMYLQMEEFNKINNVDKIEGGSKKKHKRLVGGISAFENIIETMKETPLFKEFMDYSKASNQYTDDDIKLVIGRILLRINNNENEIEELDIQTDELLEIDYPLDETLTVENNLLLDELEKKLDDLKEENKKLKSQIQLLEKTKITDVAPFQDVLDNKKFTELEQEFLPKGLKEKEITQEDINKVTDENIKEKLKEKPDATLEEKNEFKKKYIEDTRNSKFKELYGIPATSVKQLYQYKSHLGIDDVNVSSSNILKTIQSFTNYTDIRGYVDNLIYIIEEANTQTVSDDYINLLKNNGIKISDKLEKQMKEYTTHMKPVPGKQEAKRQKNLSLEQRDPRFYINGEFDEALHSQLLEEYEKNKYTINKILEAKELSKPGENWYKVTIKQIFLDVLKYKLIGKKYIDINGKCNEPPNIINLIYKDKKDFVDSSEFKGKYNYDKTKEFGNLYELLEGLRYAEKIAKIVKYDFPENIQEKVYKEVLNHLRKNAYSLNTVYGYYMADVERIDNVIIIKEGNKEYIVNIETKASGRVKSNPFNKLENYPTVYTGLKKLNLLMKEYFNGDETNKIIRSYNTLYYKQDYNVIDKVFSVKNYSVKPNTAVILNIQNFINELDIKLEDIQNFPVGDIDENKKGKKGKKKEYDENDIYDYLRKKIYVKLAHFYFEKHNLLTLHKIVNLEESKENKTKKEIEKINSEINSIQKKQIVNDEDLKYIDNFLNEETEISKFNIKLKNKFLKPIILKIRQRGMRKVQDSVYLDIPTLVMLGVVDILETDIKSITKTFDDSFNIILDEEDKEQIQNIEEEGEEEEYEPTSDIFLEQERLDEENLIPLSEERGATVTETLGRR